MDGQPGPEQDNAASASEKPTELITLREATTRIGAVIMRRDPTEEEIDRVMAKLEEPRTDPGGLTDEEKDTLTKIADHFNAATEIVDDKEEK